MLEAHIYSTEQKALDAIQILLQNYIDHLQDIISLMKSEPEYTGSVEALASYEQRVITTRNNIGHHKKSMYIIKPFDVN